MDIIEWLEEGYRGGPTSHPPPDVSSRRTEMEEIEIFTDI